MTIGDAQQAIRETIHAIESITGRSQYTCFLYGSLTQGFYQPGESNVNLLFILGDKVDILAVRAAFLPVWQKWKGVLRVAPLITSRVSWERYMRLHPALASHISAHGRPFPPDRPAPPRNVPARKGVTAAYIAQLGKTASTAIAPELFYEEDERREQAPLLLRRLVRQRTKLQIPDEELPESLLAQFFGQPAPVSVRGRISHFTSRLTGTLTGPLAEGQPYQVPYLVASYQQLDDLVLVLSNSSRVGRTDWSRVVAQARAGGYHGLQIVTDQQLLLAVQKHGALDVSLRTYQHKWGEDILAKLQFPRWRVMRDAARSSAEYQVVKMPHTLLTTPDTPENNAKIIHDYQNKLLNLRLENELLSRLSLSERVQPQPELPDRTAPHEERLRAIMSHFDWWSDYYTRQMMTRDE